MICFPDIYIYTKADEAAYERFCRIQGYSGPIEDCPVIKDANGNKITGWTKIADECVYAPTSKVHVFKTMGRANANTKNMKLGDIIYIKSEGGYRNEGIYVFDGTKISKLDGYPDDYGTIPLWASRLPITYFSVPSKYIMRSYGYSVIDHNVYFPMADPKEWIDQIKVIFDTNVGANYRVVKDRYVVINDSKVYNIEDNDDLYLRYNGSLFYSIDRENIPKHGIIHRSHLDISDKEAIIWEETGIPPHQFYYTS